MLSDILKISIKKAIELKIANPEKSVNDIIIPFY